jgi:enamine deaminase RidA (YjgF/YER057c/UK114 family)
VTVHLFSPDGMMQPVPYSHVSVASGSRHIHVAGQIGRDAVRDVLAPDLQGQVAQALRNTARGLASTGASFSDVVRLRFFVTQWSPEKMDDFMAGVDLVAAELGLAQPMPPASLIGVEILFEPDVLVEVEAYAILD